MYFRTLRYKFRPSLINFFYFCGWWLLFSTEISSGLKKKKKKFEFNEILIEGKCLWKKILTWNKNLDSLISRPWPKLLPITVNIYRCLYSHELFLPLLDTYCWLDSRMVNLRYLRFACIDLIVTCTIIGTKIQFFFLYLFYSILFYSYNWDFYDTKYIWLYLNEFWIKLLLFVFVEKIFSRTILEDTNFFLLYIYLP